jgi:transcriptional regulator
MLVAEEAVEIRVLRRQGKSIREIARMIEASQHSTAPSAGRRATAVRA